MGNCDGAAPAGVRTRSRTCIDQDMIRHPWCSATVTENCCDPDTIHDEFTSEACDPGCGKGIIIYNSDHFHFSDNNRFFAGYSSISCWVF